MLKKIMKAIRCELLKVDWVKREVEAYQTEQEKQRNDLRFARIMHAGQAVREIKPKKVVCKPYIDSVQWGGTKI